MKLIPLLGTTLLRVSPTYPDHEAHQPNYFVPAAYPEEALISMITYNYRGGLFLPYVLIGESNVEGLQNIWRHIANLPNVVRGELNTSKAIMISHLYSILQILLADVPTKWPVPTHRLVSLNNSMILVPEGGEGEDEFGEGDGEPALLRRRVVEGVIMG
jgi:hypothetical protein